MYIQQHYKITCKNDLIKKLNFKNPMQLPKIAKITLKSSLNNTTYTTRKLMPRKIALEYISGQKAQTIKAKKAIANFKLKKGIPISCKVTLRNNRLNNFIDYLTLIVLPKIKDFSGISISKTQNRGVSYGIKNIQVFPEIENQYSKFSKVFGLDLIIKITSKHKAQKKILLESCQIPVK